MESISAYKILVDNTLRLAGTPEYENRPILLLRYMLSELVTLSRIYHDGLNVWKALIMTGNITQFAERSIVERTVRKVLEKFHQEKRVSKEGYDEVNIPTPYIRSVAKKIVEFLNKDEADLEVAKSLLELTSVADMLSTYGALNTEYLENSEEINSIIYWEAYNSMSEISDRLKVILKELSELDDWDKIIDELWSFLAELHREAHGFPESP